MPYQPSMLDASGLLGATTTAGRVGAVGFAAAIVVLTLALAWRFAPRAFFHGFLASVGLIFSLDVVAVHWVFGLHRVTEGPEANVIEPVIVALGIGFIIYALTRERARVRAATREAARDDGGLPSQP